MKATLDRIEGDLAVLLLREDETVQFEIPMLLLPPGSREGDVIDIRIERDELTTREARERVSSLMQKLKGKEHSSGGQKSI